MIPSGFIQDLLARIDIVEVVGRHVELKKAGINHKGLCPFHGEKTPSFIVSPSRQTYHCFGCGAHGDAVRFLTDHVGLGFVEAVHELAQQVGLPIPEDPRSDDERADARRRREAQHSLTELLERAAQHYRQQLRASGRAIDYLKGRGLTGVIAARFGLGYAPDGWRSLASAVPDYEDPRLVEAGLVIVQGDTEPEQRRYDRFRDRIMFPIRSVRGEVVGFGGRVLGDGEPKYLNSPETPVFVKGQELYGLYEARPAIRRAGYTLVVEGYMDVVALAQHGIEQAVATLGTACTEDHVRKIFRFTDSVIFSFDGDAAGRKAARRALEASLPHASDLRVIRFLFLPAEHDPDSFVRERGPEAFEEAARNATPLSAFLIEGAREGCDLSTPEGRARFLAQAQPLWSRLPEGLLAGQVLTELARIGGTTPPSLQNAWGPPGGGRGPAGDRPGSPGAAPAAGPGVRHASARTDSGRGSDARLGNGRPAGWLRATSGGRAGGAGAGVRQVPRTAADRLTGLLLTHPEWWPQLAETDRQHLELLPPAHRRLLTWLERLLEHEGSLPWASVRSGLEADPELHALWRGLQAEDDPVWVADAASNRPGFEDVRRLLDALALGELARRQTALAQEASADPARLPAYRAAFEQWQALKRKLDESEPST